MRVDIATRATQYPAGAKGYVERVDQTVMLQAAPSVAPAVIETPLTRRIPAPPPPHAGRIAMMELNATLA
jgi:hypothetical protein